MDSIPSLDSDFKEYLSISTKPDTAGNALQFWFDQEELIMKYLVQKSIPVLGLRLARNLCMQTNFQSHFFHSKTFPLLLDLIDAYLEGSCELELRAAAQVLSNLTVQNAETQIGIWEVCFPERFRKICALDDSSTVSAASACMLNCILADSTKIHALIDEGILFDLISKHILVENERSFHWIFLLAKQACLQGQLEDLITKCPGIPKTLTPERLAILQVWEKVASEASLEDFVNLNETLQFLVSLLETINTSLVIQKYSTDIAEEITTELQFEGCNCILESIVQVSAKCAERSDILEFLGETKIITMMVQLLQMTNQFEQQAPVELQNLEGHYTGRNECILEDGSGEKFSFKKSLVKILANICYECKANQDKIREAGGIELILNCCRVDENHPYLKEWALFAVRNVTKDNLENIQHIEAFQKQGETKTTDPLLEEALQSGRIKITRADQMM